MGAQHVEDDTAIDCIWVECRPNGRKDQLIGEAVLQRGLQLCLR
jgi:hypothetical protein